MIERNANQLAFNGQPRPKYWKISSQSRIGYSSRTRQVARTGSVRLEQLAIQQKSDINRRFA